MSGSFLSGPAITGGPLFGMGNSLAPQEYGVEFGPNISYQGDAIPDVRFPMNKDNTVTGSIPAHLNSPYFLLTDKIPAASTSTLLTVAGNAVSGTAFANVATASAGVTLNVPFYQFGTTTLVSNAICLDFGWGTLNCTSGSATATPSTGTLGIFYPGQWIVVGSVGNAGGTLPLITQVVSVGATTITMANAAAATNATAPVGSGNVFTTLGGNNTATAHTPYLAAGLARILDPLQTTSRGVGILGVTGGTGGNVTIRGYDMYGQPQSEVIAVGAGATTTYSKKTYKWFLSATPAFSDAHNYTVLLSDVFGFAVRADRWEYTNLFWNGAFLTASTGWLAGDQTSPATTATGDVRGTIQVGPAGGGTQATATTANGSIRLAIFMTVPLYNLIAANPNNPAPLYGVTPV